MTTALIGKVVTAEVIRLEEYGIYLRFSNGNILVLIPDVSSTPIHLLEGPYRPGDRVRVRILRYVEQHQTFMGSMRDVRDDEPETG